MHTKQNGYIFQDEETFNRIYSECLENEPMASDKVKKSYNEMGHWFEEYMSAVQEDLFRYAYQCGYEAAKMEKLERMVPVYLQRGGAL